MFPPLYPTYEIKVKCKTEYSTCHAKIKRTVSLFSAQDTQSQPEAGLWQAAYAPICSRQSYFTQDHSGWRALMRVLQTHLPTFWGQSSVEHHSCQRLLLHAHNNLFVSHMPITGDAAAVFIYQCHKINYLLAATCCKSKWFPDSAQILISMQLCLSLWILPWKVANPFMQSYPRHATSNNMYVPWGGTSLVKLIFDPSQLQFLKV